MVIDPVLLRTSQAAAGIVFGLAALAKLIDMPRFTQALASYGLLPGPLVPPLAWVLALAELTVAIALPVDALRQFAALGGLALLALFFGAIAVSLARGNRDIDCGCWAFGQKAGATPAGLSGWHLVRVALLTVLLAPSLLDPSGRAVVWMDYVTVLGSLAVAAGGFFVIDLLLANQAAARKMGS